MDPSDAIQLLIVFILLAFSAIFSSAETSLTTANRIRMRNLADEGDRRAVTYMKITENQGKMLSAILIGNNIVNLTISSMATMLATRLMGSAGAGVATGIATLLVLVFGEISPKTFATVSPDKLALFYARPISMLMTLFTPLIFAVNKLSRGLLILFHIDPDTKTDAITESDLRTMVDFSHEEGVIESEERKMINNVFDFGDSCTKDIMIPRIDMTFIDVNATYEEVINTYRQDMFTRMPVYEDTTDNVIGMINMKDLLLYRPDGQFSVKNVMREAFFTYEYKKTSELFIEMRSNSVSMAIVLDEYGATAGLVTLEDLLEEIVGEIRDEYDEDELDSVQKISELEYKVAGSVKLDDLNDLLELNLSSDDYDSLGGLVIGLLDHIPAVGEQVSENGFTFVVDSVDKNRIEWVHMYLPQPEEETAEEEA